MAWMTHSAVSDMPSLVIPELSDIVDFIGTSYTAFHTL